MALNLIMLGPPGAGKGTQAERLSARLRVPHIATGDLFREHLRQATPLGTMAKTFMDRGELVPDAIVLRVVREQMRDGGLMDDGFVLDGFPRTVAQAEALDAIASERPLDAVIDLVVPRDLVLSRLSARRVCRDCDCDGE